MGMYCGLMLTPTAPGIVPGANAIIELLNWLVAQGDIQPPSVENPIEIDTLEDEEDVGLTELEFTALDDELETFLNNSPNWKVFLSLRFQRMLENAISTDSLSHILKLSSDQKGRDSNNLKTISIAKVNIKSFAWGNWDKGWPDRDFSITLCSDLKMRDEGGLEDNYPEVAWEKLVAAGKIEQMQYILGFTLEPWPYIC